MQIALLHIKNKIARALAVIVRQLMQQFSDPTFDFCGYLEALPQTNEMFMGNVNITPPQPHNYLYHAYLVYMGANVYKHVLSLKMFGLGLPMILKEYGINYEKRHTKQETQTNLTLREDSND